MVKMASYVNEAENGCVLTGANLPQARFFAPSVHECVRGVQNGAGRADLGGWEAAPVGRRCPECGGPVRLREDLGGWERHGCGVCWWEERYRTK